MARQQGPERRCIVSGTVTPKRSLLRFVVGPEGQAVPDLAGKLPGRGMYVSGDRDTLGLAIEKRAFSRSAKAPVVADAALIDQTYGLVVRRVLDLFGLARRSGALVVGFEQVYKALLSDVAVVITAADAADDGAGKIKARLAHQARTDVPHVTALARDDLSAALGQLNVVHAVVVGSKNYGPAAIENLKIAVDWLMGLTPQSQTADKRTATTQVGAVAGDKT